ncbi:hypothetical protein PH552_30120 [Rhizobium sp. CNPSo 3968]|uniref:hypothetical protein n=1 Tax=Rhizobium sp. CNPSo 3968 TaxID=3021408 RepID=UPI0017C64AA9|nr:hypothetical protein [Rhizobium sp. CNPSo 3968]MDK4723617.1 hypothetical protein [Rhizobium sp. CNPSo 3968]
MNHKFFKSKTILWVCDLEQFQEKCIAVFRPELRKYKWIERFRDSKKSEKALGSHGHRSDFEEAARKTRRFSCFADKIPAVLFQRSVQAMIWFDAVLEHPADDDLLRGRIAAMLDLRTQSVDIVHDIGEMRDAPVTCVVGGASEDAYSQIVTIYLSGDLQQPDIIESGARLARLLGRSLLLADDATSDPYSFILVSETGVRSVVSVDPGELDMHDRYVIQARQER